jgi:hypothetical protein
MHFDADFGSVQLARAWFFAVIEFQPSLVFCDKAYCRAMAMRTASSGETR